MLADGQPMAHLQGDRWATECEARRLVAVYQPGARTVDYRLKQQDALSARLPAELPVADFTRRTFEEGEGELYSLYCLYSSVTEPSDAVEHVYDGPVTVLVGREPLGPEEPQWAAQLAYELGNRPEYRHLVPGYIPGLRKHLMAVFKAMPWGRRLPERPGAEPAFGLPAWPCGSTECRTAANEAAARH